MERADFVGRFGSIFEHSPWVADRAFDQIIKNQGETQLPTHSQSNAFDPKLLSRDFLHEEMCAAFDQASATERLAVLRAHPDLAGKLAQAKRLTSESTSEQASAGLDSLTDEERALFTDLNTRYVRKFAFPFIICVRDYDKPRILVAFQKRLNETRETEFGTACAEVKRIAWHRLHSLFNARTE